jgi:hypothetical protein
MIIKPFGTHNKVREADNIEDILAFLSACYLDGL